ncbi:MAG: hypothetical protein ACKVU1_12265 [bacterium]
MGGRARRVCPGSNARAIQFNGLVFAARIALAGLLIALAPRPAAAQERRIVHEPPASLEAGRAWECVVQVARPNEWEELTLFHRRAGETAYTLVALRIDRGAFRAAVPGEAVAPPAIEYFVAGRASGGIEATYPLETPRERPVRVSVSARPGSQPAQPAPPGSIIVLSPADGEITDSPTPDIAALFDPPLSDASRATLFVDGEEKSAECERTVDFLLYTPKTALATGAHEASIVAFPDSGAPIALSWRFHVLEASGGDAARGAAHSRDTSLYGRWEAGWALVRAEDEPDPDRLPYDETSDATFYASLDGARGATAFHADASRDPIYDDEIRATARIDRPGLRIEGGDIYPYLSELSVAWQSGKGAFLAKELGRANVSLFGMRTLEADIFEGFGTYSQFLYGAEAAVRAGHTRFALAFLYGHDREASVPDSARFTNPQANRVVTFGVSRRFTRRIQVAAEGAHASTSEDETETANAARIVATLGEAGKNEIKLEVHDYGRGFFSIGSPTTDSGERGAVIDASGRLPAKFRANVKAEIYTDRDIFQPLEEGSPILQFTSRLDREFARGGATLSTYLFGRFYRVPFDDIPYENRYGTLGVFAQRGRGSASASVTRSQTESAVYDTTLFSDDGTADDDATVSGSEREWTLNGTAAYSGLLGCVTPRAGLRWTHTDPALDASEDRWTATAQTSVTIRRTTLSTEYQRVEESSDGGGEDDFVEHLLTVMVGRAF